MYTVPVTTFDVASLVSNVREFAGRLKSMNVTSAEYTEVLGKLLEQAKDTIKQFADVPRLEAAITQCNVALQVIGIPAKDMTSTAWTQICGINTTGAKRSGGMIRGRWNVEYGTELNDAIDLLEESTKIPGKSEKRSTRSTPKLKLALLFLICQYLPWANLAPDEYTEDDRGRSTFLPDGRKLDADVLAELAESGNVLDYLKTVAGTITGGNDELTLIVAVRLGAYVYTTYNPVKRKSKDKSDTEATVENESESVEVTDEDLSDLDS